MHNAVALASAALLGLSVLAFWPGYLGKPLAEAGVYVHAHAVAGAAWMLLLLAQALLIRSGRRALHRALGSSSLLLAPAFVVSSVLLAHWRFSRMDAPTFEQEAYTLYLPLSAALLFALAWSLALIWRRTVALHARFMACTALLLVDPVLGRVLGLYVIELPAFWHYQIITFGLEALAALAMLATLGAQAAAVRRPFAAFAAFYLLVLALWFVLPQGALWRAGAAWFRALPLT